MADGHVNEHPLFEKRLEKMERGEKVSIILDVEIDAEWWNNEKDYHKLPEKYKIQPDKMDEFRMKYKNIISQNGTDHYIEKSWSLSS